MKKVSNKNKYRCSDGKTVSQGYINNKLDETRLTMRSMAVSDRCQAYPLLSADDFDHTISQKRCKELGKTELIWSSDNIVLSSREAHGQWESYKSGLFEDHANVKERMLFVKKHDPETFEKRMANMSNDLLMKYLRDNDQN